MKPVLYRSLEPRERRIIRENYVTYQNGLCWFCKQPLDSLEGQPARSAKINNKLFPEGFFKYHVHLHHDHNTGYTIGAVHNKCNAYLWQYLGES